MSPRAYRRGRREAAAEETRERVLVAARELLAAPGGLAGFSIDAVAAQADVARMSVYYQSESKRGLLEALFDELAARGRIAEGLASAFQCPDPHDVLAGFVAAFGRFWTADRVVTRRLRALAALDPELGQAVRARDERRRRGAQAVVSRLAGRDDGAPALRGGAQSPAEAADLLHTLASFETFDTLAGEERTPEEVTPVVLRLVRAVLGLQT